jgi:mono/diheme cytochrome c family protein
MIRNLFAEFAVRRIDLWRGIGPGVAGLGLALLIVAPVQTLFAQTVDAVESGHQQFDDKCAVCHGTTGVGDGVLAEGLRQKPADLTRISERNGGTFPTSKTFAKIWGRDDEIISTHNMSEMPAFYNAPVFGHDKDFEESAGRLSPQQIRDIIAFLVTIQEQQSPLEGR